MKESFEERWVKFEDKVTEIVEHALEYSPLNLCVNDYERDEQLERRAEKLISATQEIRKLAGQYQMCLRGELPARMMYVCDVRRIVQFFRIALKYAEANTEEQIVDHNQQLVIINAPEWFKDADFAEWVKAKDTATWHAGETDMHTHSDVFFTYNDGQGSDFPKSSVRPSIPAHIWDQVELMLIGKYGPNVDALVWVTNGK